LGAFDFTFEVVWTEFYQAGGNAPLLSPADIRTSVEMAQSREQSSLRKTSTESNSITADPPTHGSHLCTTQHLLQIKMPVPIYPRLSRQCLVYAQPGPILLNAIVPQMTCHCVLNFISPKTYTGRQYSRNEAHRGGCRERPTY
jgi:hypothetical protein